MMKSRTLFIGSLLVLFPALLGIAFYIIIYRNLNRGLTCTISCPKMEFKQGDEISINFHIKNYGKSPVPFLSRWFVRSGRWDEYRLVAKREDGSVVVDPQVTGLIFGGGPGLQTTIDPGESFSRTFSLNEWALISEPGRYNVTGIFTNDIYADREAQILVHSKPIEIVIKPRTYEEMGQHINRLVEQLHTVEEKGTIVKKLKFTRDRRIVPALLEFEYSKDGEGYAYGALMHYLPLEEETKSIVLDRARKCGLVESTFEALERFGCTNEQFTELIKISLESNNPRCITTGAKAARRYPDDSHIPRLIELSKSTKNSVQREVIRALARNRTEKGVEILRELLNDPNEYVRHSTVDAIKTTYISFQVYSGVYGHYKPIKHNIFGSTSEIIDVAIDPNNPERWEAITELAWRIDKEKIDLVKALIGSNDKDIPEVIADKGDRTIISLLRDPHKDVRDTTATIIRLVHRMNFGRPLREHDFPEIFKKAMDSFGKAQNN